MNGPGIRTGLAAGLVACLLACPLACDDSRTPPSSPEIVSPVETPTAAGSGEPGLTVGADDRLYLSWIDPAPGGHALRFALWEDDRWSAPRTIAEGDRWFVNWADVPSLAALRDGTLAAHWLAKSADATYAYDVRLSVSRDRGESWSDPVRAHDDGTATEHGFASIVPHRDAFDVVWLDGRRTADDPPGPMTLRHARLDTNGRIGPSSVVDDRVCDCCPTDAVRADDGLLLVYRDRSPQEIRDVWFARHDGLGWSTPRSVWDDGWKTAGCPVNGPAVDADGRAVAAAWFTMEDTRRGIVRAAFSSDGGRSFGEPVRIDDGDPIGRVDVAWLPEGSARVTWLENAGAGAAILVRDVGPDGAVGDSRVVTYTSVSRSSGYPKVAFHHGRTYVAWTAVGETTRVRTGLLE